ncbi:DUF6953 family protein [Methylobacterium brachythecii]|uniref:Uncharacterized protein n=1 Tax=Methylobacterium brachythecii TaxID=1176177 RepID=A0ABQ6CXU7_9HYPH|nr:hypothetical protein [Methylobacterium brachythecii]GLS42924.1 hypothetical protein GCM10007884_09090 [Methylobacterium brachythecii]
MTTDAADVAIYMVNQLDRKKYLYQEEVVDEIVRLFGRPHYYENEAGNHAISKEVLKEFRKLTNDNVVWERGERCWRRRLSDDAGGRMQD